MNYSPSDVLRQQLVQSNIVQMPDGNTTNTWPIFVPRMPMDSDNAVAIKDTAGRMEGRCMQTGQMIEHPGFQLKVRAVDMPTAYDFIRQLADAVDAIRSVNVAMDDGTVYLLQAVTRTSPPIDMGEETERQRHVFVFNGLLSIQEVD